MSNDRYSGQRECGCGRVCPVGQPCQCGRWNEPRNLPRFRPTIRDPEPDWEAEAKRLQAEVERLTAELAIATAIGEANRGETVAMFGTVDAVFPDEPPEPACTCHRRLDGPPPTRDAMIEAARAYMVKIYGPPKESDDRDKWYEQLGLLCAFIGELTQGEAQ